MTEKVPVMAWLERPYWPWPVALAYSQPPEVRDAALGAAVEILELYPQLGSMAEYAGGSAVHRVYEVVTAQQGVGHLQEEILRSMETSLIGAILAGKINPLGRTSPTALLDKIDGSAWVGAEIDGDATCDLVKAGWREKSLSDLDALLGKIERVVWYYDVHLPQDQMIAAFGELPGAALIEPAPVAEPWTEEKMRAEIAACSVSNRDRAWRDVFKPNREEHGWDNAAFRAIWSEGRSSKGMIGRPSKRA